MPSNHHVFLSGIDVSHFQGEINWQKVKESGVKCALAKATEGGDWQDPEFQTNWRGMKENQVVAGAYHFFRGTSLPDLQAKNIVSVLEKVLFNPEEDLLAIDVERNDDLNPKEVANRLDQLINNLSSFLQKPKEQLFIYTSPDWWDSHVDYTLHDFEKYPLWVAHWTDKPQPKLPQPWKGWSIWQYSNKGQVDGIGGPVDLDRVNPDSLLMGKRPL